MFMRLGRLWLALLLCATPSLAGAAEPVSGPPPPAPELFPAHRYALVGGGALLLGGVGLGLYARSEAQRAQQLIPARDAAQALDHARDAAASANLLYGVAGMALLYGVLLELLPQPAAEKASLTFHF